ncbi:MAG: hypothetical protein VX777_08040 [Chlamydiota bacterium]|nr:hypothetical protein [Chlamydiota bacterium]
MVFDPNAFPTSALPPEDPNATLADTNYQVVQIPNSQSADGSIYLQNQVGFSKTLIIDRILYLTIKMIGVLQQAAAAQANRINFLTQWQKAYTDVMDQVHAFTVNNGDKFDSDSDSDNDKETTLQQNLNQVNSVYTTTETNRRSIISDDAKSLQTTVNQTSDAVNSQSSLAKSFLQELNSLLSTIFRST